MTQGAASQAESFIPKKAQKVLGAVRTAAAAYGIVSQGAKILPEAFEAGKLLVPAKGGDPAWFEFAERTLQDLAMGFHKLENKITSLPQSFFEATVPFNEAARRITGETPDSLYYTKQNASVLNEQKDLRDKFELWKGKEAPLNTLNTILDVFKRSLTR